jgi:phospholipase C
MDVDALRKFSAGLAGLLLLQPSGFLFAHERDHDHQDEVKKYYISPDHEPHMARSELIERLRKKVKYVFVFYQENRSFDSYFGTFPGAEGLFSHPANETQGFTQELVNTDGSMTTIQPFRIGPNDQCPKSTVNGTAAPGAACYAADTDDIDHSHPRIVAKMDLVNDVPLMDRFAVTEELKYSPTGNPSLKAKQFGELAMAYEDCDTVPLLWNYADKFVLFDHIFQTMTGPSTPGNLAIIGAQSGQTQWALHPEEGYTDNGSSAQGVPVLNDRDPFWGSALDSTQPPARMPVTNNGAGTASPQINLTFATLPLTLPGRELNAVVKSDSDPEGDLGDVQDDVAFVSRLHKAAVPFGWYEEGYDKEPTDPGPVDANGTHASYITHHNGPQYFGYVSNNSQMRQQLHGLGDFFSAVENRTLSRQGGVFFVKGGFPNIFNLKPADPDTKVQSNFLGDDDHPAYSDAQISEALVAEGINKIASSPYWWQSAIIITWDDSEGDYDHVQPPIRRYGPDGSLITNGPRVPFILISPYARTHYIERDQGSQSSVVKFIDAVFDLPPLALLPDELKGRELGEKEFGQKGLGPEDALTPGVTDLLDAFSPARLSGKADPLPPDYVTISEALIDTLPQSWGFGGCAYLGITTTDRQQGITNAIPSDFNPRPSTNPN